MTSRRQKEITQRLTILRQTAYLKSWLGRSGMGHTTLFVLQGAGARNISGGREGGGA